MWISPEIWQNLLLLNRSGEIMKKILKQFCRFSAVGVVSFLIDYGLLFAFTETFHVHYLLSSALSFSAATVFNYVYSTKYVFACAAGQRGKGRFSIFLLLSGCGLLWNSMFMKTLVEHLELHYMLAKICAALLVSVWNFGSRKLMLEEEARQKIAGMRKELLQRF